MVLSDLKVVSAHIQVDNSNEENGKYKISASFRTQAGVIKGIDGGIVVSVESGKQNASFYKNVEFEDSLHVAYMNESVQDVAVQCDIIQLINEFVTIAQTKAVNEA